MAEIGSGDYKTRQAKKAAEAAKQAEAGLATQGLQLRCDVNGCVIVPINARQSTPGLTGDTCHQYTSVLLHALLTLDLEAIWEVVRVYAFLPPVVFCPVLLFRFSAIL